MVLVKNRSLTLIASFSVALLVSMNQAQAQCRGGGGGGGGPTGSTSSFAISPNSFSYPSNALTMSGYPSSPTMAFNSYQQRTLQMQNQIYATANQMAAEQAQKRAAYEQMVRPFRLARAEATREKRAERIAALKAKYDSSPQYRDDERYSLASVSR